MGRTIAEMLIDKGRAEGEAKGEAKGQINQSRAILLMQLQHRFKKLPRKVEKRIAATQDNQVLQSWLAKVIDAATLEDVGIPLDD